MTTIYATSKPINEMPPGRYQCKRCGIIRERNYGTKHTGYCSDCAPEARNLGWLPRRNST